MGTPQDLEVAGEEVDVTNMKEEDLQTETVKETGESVKPWKISRSDTCRNPPPPAKIRVDNLHYDLTEDDLYVRIARLM